MAAYNETMVAAGIMHAGEGLHPSSNDSRRIIWHPESEKKTEVVPGPFPVKELVCGWWIIKVGSVEEAVEWAEKCPCMEEVSILTYPFTLISKCNDIIALLNWITVVYV